MVLGFRSPEIEPEEEEEGVAVRSDTVSKTDLNMLRVSKGQAAIDHPYSFWRAGAVLDVGTQVISIDTIINYAGEMGIGLSMPKCFLHAYLHDYFLYVGNPSYSPLVSQTTALKFCSTLGSILSLGVVLLNFRSLSSGIRPISLSGCWPR